MDGHLQVLIVETDESARTQMKNVLAAMGLSVTEACDQEEIDHAAAEFEQKGAPPDLIIVRVTLPEGSGVQVMNDLCARFPNARRLLVSHYAKSLLFSIPDFASCEADFLQAEFTDREFRKCVERTLAKRETA